MSIVLQILPEVTIRDHRASNATAQENNMAFETNRGTLDFARCKAHAETLSTEELVWSARDAKACAEIWDNEECTHLSNNMVCTNSGKYWDEYYTYVDEIRRRRSA